MANPEHVEILEQGVAAWNKWRDENLGVVPDLCGAHLHEAELRRVNFRNADLSGADLLAANLSKALLSWANLRNADIRTANLQGAELYEADLRNAKFRNANLKNTWLSDTKLQGTDFSYAIVDGGTLIAGPTKRDPHIAEIDRETNFEGVALEAMRIDPGIKQLLEYNIRRKNWGKWYEEHKFLKYIVKAFWQISDYGLSTKTIILKFFKWAAVFALVYLFFEYSMQDGIVNNLSQVDGQQVQWWLVPIRAFYFSVVTMTTLGFGDMYARFNSLLGHLLLMIQVLMGYMFLGALVTRFAVLFTAGGPAAKFTELNE